MIADLPDKIKRLRLQHNLTQKQVAEMLGVSPSVISGYETGERTPSLEVILKFAHLYKCSTDYLLGKVKTDPDCLLDLSGLSPEQRKALRNLIKTMNV